VCCVVSANPVRPLDLILHQNHCWLHLHCNVACSFGRHDRAPTLPHALLHLILAKLRRTFLFSFPFKTATSFFPPRPIAIRSSYIFPRPYITKMTESTLRTKHWGPVSCHFHERHFHINSLPSSQQDNKVSQSLVPFLRYPPSRHRRFSVLLALSPCRAGSWSLRALRRESDCGPLLHYICNIDLIFSSIFTVTLFA